MTSKGPSPCIMRSSAFLTGFAKAKIRSAAISRRRAVNHHGLFAGVSSCCFSSASTAVGGKTSERGRGGVRRSNHQITDCLCLPLDPVGTDFASGYLVVAAFNTTTPARGNFSSYPHTRTTSEERRNACSKPMVADIIKTAAGGPDHSGNGRPCPKPQGKNLGRRRPCNDCNR